MDERYERKDIPAVAYPFPLVMFGDGLFAQVIEIVDSINSDKESVKRIRIIPTKELNKKYNISTEENLDEQQSIWITIPEDHFQVISDDPSNPVRFFCFLNFKGQETRATMFWQGFKDMEQLRGMRNLMALKDAQIAAVTEQLNIALTNMSEYIRIYIAQPAAEMSALQLAQQLQQNQQPVRQ